MFSEVHCFLLVKKYVSGSEYYRPANLIHCNEAVGIVHQM